MSRTLQIHGRIFGGWVNLGERILNAAHPHIRPAGIDVFWIFQRRKLKLTVVTFPNRLRAIQLQSARIHSDPIVQIGVMFRTHSTSFD